MPRRTRTRRREKKFVPQGRVYVHATFNNTVVTLTDMNGDVVSWGSGGTVGFKGSRKGTAYASQRASENAARRAMDQGMRSVEVLIRGPGAGREAAVRAIQSAGLRVTAIRDVTPIPHNGCRPPKEKRT